jgi:hypothetical protein
MVNSNSRKAFGLTGLAPEQSVQVRTDLVASTLLPTGVRHGCSSEVKEQRGEARREK